MSLCATPVVHKIPHLTDWCTGLQLQDNLIPKHADTWDRDDLAYNMEISDDDVVVRNIVLCAQTKAQTLECFIRAGPRSKVLFRGPEVRAAIVTCGGLCPGLNNVVRDLVLRLSYNYGMKTIHGIRNGCVSDTV